LEIIPIIQSAQSTLARVSIRQVRRGDGAGMVEQRNMKQAKAEMTKCMDSHLVEGPSYNNNGILGSHRQGSTTFYISLLLHISVLRVSTCRRIKGR
jgi:hypothetical protein